MNSSKFLSSYLRIRAKTLLLIIICVLCGCALDWWFSSHDDVINHDAVTYLYAAELWQQARYPESLNIFYWPLYPAVIAVVSSITNLDLESSARVINTVLLSSTMLVFLSILSLLSRRDMTLLWIGVGLLLISPSLNKYRILIIRDFGYWLFYLCAIYYALRYCQYPQWNRLLLVGFFLLCAGLFRIEGILQLILLPLAIYYWSNSNNYKTMCVVLFIAILGCVFAYIWMSTVRYYSIYEHLQESFNTVLKLAYFNLTREHGTFSNVWQFAVNLPARGMLVLHKIMHQLSYVLFFLALFAWYKKLIPEHTRYRKIFISIFIANFMIFLAYALDYGNFVTRYAMPLALVALLLTAFTVRYLLHKMPQMSRTSRITCIVLATAFIAYSGTRLEIKYKHLYILDAAHWIKNNASPSENLFSNNKLVNYYADRTHDVYKDRNIIFDQGFANSPGAIDIIAQYDYAAFELSSPSDDDFLSKLRMHFGTEKWSTPAYHDNTIYIFRPSINRRSKYQS